MAKWCACVALPTSCSTYDLRVSARRLSTRRKAFPGFCPFWFHRQGDAGSSGSQVNSPSAYGPQGYVSTVGKRIGRISESDSGVPEGDEGNVRGRHGSVKALQGPRRSTEGPHPRRSNKNAGLRGAPQRDRPKLTTANSFVDSPLPCARECAGVVVKGTQDFERDDGSGRATAPCSMVQRGGRRSATER